MCRICDYECGLVVLYVWLLCVADSVAICVVCVRVVVVIVSVAIYVDAYVVGCVMLCDNSGVVGDDVFIIGSADVVGGVGCVGIIGVVGAGIGGCVCGVVVVVGGVVVIDDVGVMLSCWCWC